MKATRRTVLRAAGMGSIARAAGGVTGALGSVSASKVRLTLLKSRGTPLIRAFSIFRAPEVPAG